MEGTEDGLGSQAFLAKIDKLRELNIGSMIPLPQLVVVGDQSSGKSSVLESLTGFSFPRAAGLCTRYATQITCIRDLTTSVSISIIPRPNADENLKKKLLSFNHRYAKDLTNKQLVEAFEKANAAMGIRMTTEEKNSKTGAFSQDILKIEISGPDQNHLTVIDVPGIFRVATPGLTTETDISLVENMVKSYMSNSRTIILAVIPCNVDIATQEILKLAEAADPTGVRTMGVLTKPDLATERITQKTIKDLVLGKQGNLKLGYYVVKNRSADDKTSTLADRAAAEEAFFMAPPWNGTKNRCGVRALKDRLRELLLKISRNEFPQVKREVNDLLQRSTTELEQMGPSRGDQTSQRQYLGKLANRFQNVTQAALNGYYAGEALFAEDDTLRLITQIFQLQTEFASVFHSRSHMEDLDEPDNQDESGDETDNQDESDDETLPDDQSVPENKGKRSVLPGASDLQQYHELQDIILPDPYECPMPGFGSLMDRVRDVYHSSRGPDLGTFGGTVLSTVFQQQTEKWEPLMLSHVSNSIYLVHDFIFRLLQMLCPEEQVRNQLWGGLLVDKLCAVYRKAMKHAHFLLAIERGGRPATFNHYFNDNLQKKRAARMAKRLDRLAVDIPAGRFGGAAGRYVSIENIKNSAVNKDNEEQICEDIVDTFQSYYKVSQKRFVDVLYQHVIYHYLLEGEGSPLKVFSPDLILGLDEDQLAMIAGEDEGTRQQRVILSREIASLQEALKVL